MNINELRRRRNKAVKNAKKSRKALPYRNQLTSKASKATHNVARRKAANAKRKLANRKKRLTGNTNRKQGSAWGFGLF
jgi:hypothetical protein